jgi:hypothetical protein
MAERPFMTSGHSGRAHGMRTHNPSGWWPTQSFATADAVGESRPGQRGVSTFAAHRGDNRVRRAVGNSALFTAVLIATDNRDGGWPFAFNRRPTCKPST